MPSMVADDDYLKTEFISSVQQRGAAVIKARGASSAASAACAICDHMRDWVLGSQGNIVSMGVVSDASPYGVAGDLIFSFPVICEPGGRYVPSVMSELLDDGDVSWMFVLCVSLRLFVHLRRFSIVSLGIDEFSKVKLAETEAELLAEKHMAF